MIFPGNVGVRVREAFLEFDDSIFGLLQKLIKRWLAVDFDRDLCRAELEQLVQASTIDPALFDFDAFTSGGCIARSKLFFPTLAGWQLELTWDGEYLSAPLEKTDLPHIAELLRLASSTDDPTVFLTRCAELGRAWPEFLVGAAEGASWPAVDEPGIYRREHASLVIRSRTTTLVVDPFVLFSCPTGPIPRRPRLSPVDGALITHGHADHWQPASLLYATPGPDTPVVVPFAPRANILSRTNFTDTLDALGQRSIAARWGDTLTIGDIEIDVLPFYGEQVSRDQVGSPPDVRNQGNCYRIQLQDFSLVLLVDAGTDPMGNMVDVLTESVARRGPVDAVLSCSREFSVPFNFSAMPEATLVLPFGCLRDLARQHRAGSLPPTTMGIQGIADVCRSAKAKYYLQYAQGFHGVGQPVRDVAWTDGEPSEVERAHELRAAFARAGVYTQVVDWNPGDAALCGRHDFTLRAAAAT